MLLEQVVLPVEPLVLAALLVLAVPLVLAALLVLAAPLVLAVLAVLVVPQAERASEGRPSENKSSFSLEIRGTKTKLATSLLGA